MDFESPDVAKDFPGLFASESLKRSQSHESDYTDDEKSARKDLLGKKKDKKESKKDKGYVVFEGESSEDEVDEAKSPSKNKKNRSSTFKFPGKDKKDKHGKSKEKVFKERREEKEKVCKKESKEGRKDSKENEKIKVKKKKDSKILKIRDKKKKTVDQEIKEDAPIFGVPLHVAVERNKSYDGIGLPALVRECIDYVEEHGLTCEGIYKISGLKSKVRNLKNQYNANKKVYLYEHEPHIIASLLKLFLRELPEPVLTSALTPKFEEAAALKNEQKRLETFQKLLNELPNCNRLLLSWIFVHMQHVMAMEKRNKMNLQNISIVLSPSLQMSHNVLQAFFFHANVLFKGVELKKYIPPVELDSSRLSLELPDSPSAIAVELAKQENFLNVLHAELNAGLRDPQKEEQLWEIQRVVTQLKRKMRFLKQLEDTAVSEVHDSELKCEASMKDDKNSLGSASFSRKKSLSADNLTCEISEVVKDNSTNQVSEFNNKNVLFTNKEGLENSESIISSIVNKVDAKVTDQENISALSKSQNDISINHKIEVPLCAESDANGIDESDEEMKSLLQEEKILKFQNDELLLLGDELKRKINSEKIEIDRLKMEINEYQQLYKYKRYAFDSTENSSSGNEDSSASDLDEEEDLSCILNNLMFKNKQLENLNNEATKAIQCEREICLNIKVQLKMLQAA